MTKNTKSLLKNTIMGLISGGAISALYAAHKYSDDKKKDNGFRKDEIVVPLSKKNYLSVLNDNTNAPVKDKKELVNTSSMTPQELAKLKHELLNKRSKEKTAEAVPTDIKSKTGPVSSTSVVKKSKTANFATVRDGKGRFSTEEKLDKTAGITNDAAGTLMDNIGSFGGFVTGLTAMKCLTDRIIINRKKRQLEASKRKYVDLLNNEINDEDTPYYRKQAESDRGFLGKSLGTAATVGLGTAGIAGVVVYRIMENRRKEAEKRLDKDLSRFPADKTIRYKFANAHTVKGKKSDRFFK